MNEIDVWHPENSGGRVRELDILKGQQVMGELSQIPSQIALREAQANNAQLQAQERQEAIIQSRRIQEALAKLSEQSQEGFALNDEADGGGIKAGSKWNTGVTANPLWKMSQVLQYIDPKLSGTLARQASMIDAQADRSAKDRLRAAQIATQTMSERFDIAGRRFNAVQTGEDLVEAAQWFEQATGKRTGILDENGKAPDSINLTPEAAQRFARQFADQTMKAKDLLQVQDRRARDAAYIKSVTDKEVHQAWTRNVDEQRKMAEARRRAAGEKEGEKPLTSAEQKEGKSDVLATYPGIEPKERADQLGNELMDRAKRLRADPGSPRDMTMTDAKRRIMKRMEEEGRFIGGTNAGRTPQTAADFPEGAIKNGKLDISKIEKNKWYRYNGKPYFWDGEEFLTQQGIILKRGTAKPMSGTEDSGDEDDDDDPLSSDSDPEDEDEEE